MRPEIVPARLWHARHVAGHARAADIDELWALARVTPFEALAGGIQACPESWAGLVDGVPVCVFGVGPSHDPGIVGGVPWMVGSRDLDRYAVAFLRRNRAVVERWAAEYGWLANQVDARNAAAIRWLRWLGFAILPAVPAGPDNLPFHPFYMEGGAACAARQHS